MINNRHLTAILAFVIITGMVSPVFAQIVSSGATPTLGQGAEAKITQSNGVNCVVIDFEGVGDIVPVGTIGDVTFSANALAAVDTDAGGSASIANEPSPDTIMVSTANPVITATLANPVQEISWNYVSPSPGEIRIYNSANVLIDTIPLPAIPQVNPGDPNGAGFGTWSSGSYVAFSSIIASVEYEGITNQIAWDDLDYCEFTVGGESLPIDSAALLIAGASANAVWILPILAGLAGAGVYLTRSKLNWI